MSHATSLPRSYLFVPGDRPERFAKALASGADAVVLDLEDAVAPAAKDAARDAVAAFLNGAGADRAALRRAHQRRGDAVVRAGSRSAAERRSFGRDVPEGRAHADVASGCSSGNPALRLLPLVESARGVLAAEALAAAPGVQRLVFGTIDFALDMDLGGDLAATIGLDHAASRLALASRAAGHRRPRWPA